MMLEAGTGKLIVLASRVSPSSPLAAGSRIRFAPTHT